MLWFSTGRMGRRLAISRPPSPAPRPRHSRGGPGLVYKDETFGFEVRLCLKPRPAPLQDIGTVLLGRVRGLFFSVIRRRSKKRHSVAMPKLAPFRASAVLISESVMSGVAATKLRMIS